MTNQNQKESQNQKKNCSNFSQDQIGFGIVVICLLLIFGVVYYVTQIYDNPAFNEVSNQMAYELCQSKGFESFMEVETYKYQYYAINCWKLEQEKFYSEKFYFLRHNSTMPAYNIEVVLNDRSTS